VKTLRLFLEHILGWESIFFSCISPISPHRMCFRKFLFCVPNPTSSLLKNNNIMVGDGLKNIEKIKGNVFWCCPQLSCVINLVGTLKTLLHPIPSTLKEYHHPSFPYSKKLVNFVNNCIIRLYYGVNVFG